jgi:hypothetical protein
VARHASPGLPIAFARRPLRVLRPQDADDIYAFPRPEFARLERAGALHRLASGYYAIVPADQVGRPWLPELEAAAIGIAASDDSVDAVALMGLSAARVHGAVPRAIGVAVVATTSHRRRSLRLTDRSAEIVFVRRDVSNLDLQRVSTELGACWATTVEQTLLDLAARPTVGHLPDQASEAIRALLSLSNRDLLTNLASRQRRQATLNRVLSVA